MGDIFDKYTTVLADEWRETKAELDRLRAALAAAEREGAEVYAECHRRLDAAGVLRAEGKACNDPACNTKIGHRIKLLVQQRDEARGQAIAARAGWDACVSTRAMLQAEVDRMRRARDPDELESQRATNAMLTDEVERLRALLAAAPEREEDGGQRP